MKCPRKAFRKGRKGSFRLIVLPYTPLWQRRGSREQELEAAKHIASTA